MSIAILPARLVGACGGGRARAASVRPRV